MAADPFLSAGKSQSFGGCSLNINDFWANVTGPAENFLHFRQEWGKPGSLADQGDVGIDHCIAFILGQVDDLFEEENRINTAKLGVRIGKVFADIAATQCPEEGIAQGVGENIGIGMAKQAVTMGDGDTAKDQFAAFDQAMSVEAVADA